MTRSQRMEAAAIAMYCQQECEPPESWGALPETIQAVWRLNAGEIADAAYPELASDPPTHVIGRLMTEAEYWGVGGGPIKRVLNIP